MKSWEKSNGTEKNTKDSIFTNRMKKSILLCVTDSDFTGAPVYVNQLSKILSEDYLVKFVVARNGMLLQGEELCFDKDHIFRFSDLRSIIRAIRVIKKSQPDVIWINSFKMSLIIRIGLLFTLNISPQVIYTVHGLSFRPGSTFRNGLIQYCERVFARFVDTHIFLTIYDLSMFRDRVSRNINYSVIPNFSRINPVDFKLVKSERCRNYVMIARNESQKDYDTLLRAFSLFAEGKDVKLNCVGRGTEMLKERVIKLDLQSKVLLHGESDNVYQFFESADALVLSTHYEGMPLVILEAMSMGLPIIATNVCGISEFVTNSFGLLVKPNSEKDWERALQSMYDLNSKDFNEKCLNSFEQYQEKFSLKKFNERISQLIKL